MSENLFIDSMGRVQGMEGVTFSVRETNQLRQLFLKERDEKIGLWRDPERPEIVVYPRESGSVRIVNEVNGDARYWSREAVGGVYTGWDEVTEDLWGTASRYYEAHPKPKPWHDAKDGEIGVLALEDTEERPYLVGSDGLSVYRDITTGRRIWLEGEDE